MNKYFCDCGHELHWHDDNHCYYKFCKCCLSRNEAAEKIIDTLQAKLKRTMKVIKKSYLSLDEAITRYEERVGKK